LFFASLFLASKHETTNCKPKQTIVGAVDLAVEGEMLSRLDHPNVIKLYGVSQYPSKTAYVKTERGYFLVLDILQDTLKNRLYRWKTHYLSPRRRILSSLSSSSSLLFSKQLLASVAPVAISVADGLNYLHSKGVVLRDLKPDNVGFSTDGTVKIFDLGFAREVHTVHPKERAGSYRYMAPEVGQRGGASFHSDVYSFGILLWEVCTLRYPFKHIETYDEFMDTVMMGGWRESTAGIPSPALRGLIEQCWDTNPTKRPTMRTALKILIGELTTPTSPRNSPRNLLLPGDPQSQNNMMLRSRWM
jgi:serine/threonine protein kinase